MTQNVKKFPNIHQLMHMPCCPYFMINTITATAPAMMATMETAVKVTAHTTVKVIA